MNQVFKNESTLLNQLIKGNERAYALLVRKYSDHLYSYAVSLSNDHALAEDIVQEVFLKIWKTRHQLKKDTSIKSYLYKCIYNEFVNNDHRSKKFTPIDKIHIDTLNEVIHEADSDDIQKKIELVYDEIKNLPDRCRLTFLLSKKEGLTNIEISVHLNVSVKTVENQMTKAFSILRNKLSEKINNYTVLFFNLYKKQNAFLNR